MVDLHVHTCYSLLDGMIKPEELIDKIKEQGKTAICVTDHGHLYGNDKIYKLCKKNDIKYLHGCEIYVCDNVEEKSKDNKYYHLVLICIDETGRQNLNKIVSEANQNKYYGKPRIAFNRLKVYSEGILACSACMAGELDKTLINYGYDEAKHVVSRYKYAFNNRYFIELQSHTDEAQKNLNIQLLQLAEETNTPYIITTDAHYLTQEDQDYHSKFIQINQDRDVGETYNDCYIQTEEEVYEKCHYLPKEKIQKALSNTDKIAEMCNVDIPLSAPIMPVEKIPAPFKKQIDYLWYLCQQGWKDRKINLKPEEVKEQYRKRLAYEMSAIEKMGFEGYYLYVWGYANSVKRRGIARGCFTGDALIQTKETLKNLKDVQIGDYVVSSDNQFHKVTNTFKYDIKEDMIQLKCRKQPNLGGRHTTTCTKDHKILIWKNGRPQYIEAQSLHIGDIICSPKIKNNYSNSEYQIIDLNNYNTQGFAYDDEYIYETAQINQTYLYSKRDVHRQTGLSRNCINNICNNINKVKQSTLDRLFSYIPFKTVDEWKQYIDKNSIIHRKVKRFLTLDEDVNFILAALYGDGNTGKNNEVMLAVNTLGHKTTVNKQKFYDFCKLFDCTITESTDDSRHLCQIRAYSNILHNFIQTELFQSKLNQDKIFNTKLFNQKESCIKALYDGFLYTDGSRAVDGKETFCNTSMSLVSAFKILSSMIGNKPGNLLYRTCKNNHPTWKDSYTLEISTCDVDISERYGVYDLGEYWGLEITDINYIEKIKTSVYDLTVENNHSYTINNIIVHNSGGGSLVAYLSKIVDIDPIRHGLYFERFIDVGALPLLERGEITKSELKVPDFDLDFGKEDRAKVYQFVIDRYGQSNVACLGTFQYIWAKGAIKDLGRVLGIPFEITNEMTKNLDNSTIDEALELGLLDKYTDTYPELFKYVRKLAGLPKSFSAHPCGRVASPKSMVYYNAVDINDNGDYILEGDGHTAEDLGLIKADFLGLRTVDIIYDTLELIGKDYEYIAPHNTQFDDKLVWEAFSKGLTEGIFQFESAGMKGTLIDMECSCLEDLTVANALYRPGSMSFISNYNNRKKGLEEFEYLHPDLEPILNNSYGIIVFQEQLIEIGRLAGLRNPDELRKATAKKNPKLMAKIEPELKDGLKNRGWTQDQVDTLWNIILDFARYSFNKSHACAYAIIAYICMFLKVHHTKEFMCSWINSYIGKNEHLSPCLTEAQRMGVKVYQPRWGAAYSKTQLYNDGIILGTSSLKFCNEQMADDLTQLYQSKKYNNFIELLEDISTNTTINSRQLEVLIGNNFFECFGKNKYLSSLKDLYEELGDKTQIKKDKLQEYIDKYGITEDIIRRHAGKETAKLYKDIDMPSVISELANNIPNKSFSVKEQIQFEMEKIQHVSYVNPQVSEKFWAVINIKTYSDETKPYLTLHNIQTGEKKSTKIKKGNSFIENPFGLYSIIKVDKFAEYPKTKQVGNKWVSTGEMQDILESWVVIQR